jgi:hypothetical protein
MVLKVHNLSLPLKETTTGPLLSIEDEFIEPLEWVVNSAVIGDIQQITEALACGENVFIHQQLYAVRPTLADDDLSEARARWRELTGFDPGEDVYVLGTGFTYHRVVLPRQTLQEILQALLKLRAEFPQLPFPWLFRLEPYHLTPANGEEELVRKLSERAVALKRQEQASRLAFNDSFTKLVHDGDTAGLFSEVYSEEKQYWLELWGFTTLLDYHRAALAFFNHFRYTALRVQKLPTVPNYVTQSKEPPAKQTNGAKEDLPSFALSVSINTRILA